VDPPFGRDGKPFETDRTDGKRVAQPGGTKLYSEVVGSGTTSAQFHLTVKSKGTTTPEKATELLKERINPMEIQVGINKFRVLNNGRITI